MKRRIKKWIRRCNTKKFDEILRKNEKLEKNYDHYRIEKKLETAFLHLHKFEIIVIAKKNNQMIKK